jgi:hypothetical protein
MGKLVAIILFVSFVLSTTNTLLYSKFKNSPFILMIIFLINSTVLIFGSLAISQQKSNQGSTDEVTEKSVSIFIRVLIYLLPILTLVGLYLLNKIGKLGMEEANTWVSFIMGVASFVMSLITLWQSEGTYNKIFDALRKIEDKTNSIEKDQASIATLLGISKSPGLNLNNDVVQSILRSQIEVVKKEEPNQTENILGLARNKKDES